MIDKMTQNPWNIIQSLYELQYFNCLSCSYKKSPNEFGLKAAFKKPKVLGQSPKGSKVLKTYSSQAQKNQHKRKISLHLISPGC